MDNIIVVTDHNKLVKILENAVDKLVILLFFGKNNAESRKAKNATERLAANHMLTYFCLVDTDKFEGESKYTANLTTLPKFECYYLSNMFGTFNYSGERDLENNIRAGEQYVMTQNNMKNSMSSQNQMVGTPSYTQFNNLPTQPNIYAIQQQILNTAAAQNPALLQHLIQNPALLQQQAQRQLLQLQQQQQQPTNLFSMQTQPVQLQQMQQMQPMQPMQPMQQIQQIPQPTVASALPTLQQMQQMFQIWQMMQTMGALNTSNQSQLQTQIPMPSTPMPSTPMPSTPMPSTPSLSPESDQKIVTLPNGDKIYPLPNGKYGLVKKN